MAALAPAASASAAPIGIPLTSPEDAELIALCARHSTLRRAWSASDAGPYLEYDPATDPLWQAYMAAENAIDEARPKSLAGLMAKARAAVEEATTPSGSIMTNGTTEAWSWDLVNDLLRLAGDKVAPAPADESHPDAGLLQLCVDLSKCRAKIDQFNRNGASDAEWEAALNHWNDLVEQIANIPARTQEGLRVKAGAARTVLKTHKFGGSGPLRIEPEAQEEDTLSWSLIHDVLGEEPQWS
jgi:hypothetical protein